MTNQDNWTYFQYILFFCFVFVAFRRLVHKYKYMPSDILHDNQKYCREFNLTI